MPILAVAFDCFGTVFDMAGFPHEEIKRYVEHVNKPEWSPFEFGEAWYKLKAHADSIEGITRLRLAGYACFAFSNGSCSLIDQISKNSGIEWDHIIDPSEYQTYKPKAKAYRVAAGAIGRLGYAPANTMMVTANPTFGDVEGSAAVGMTPQVIRQGDYNYPDTIVQLAEHFIHWANWKN